MTDDNRLLPHPPLSRFIILGIDGVLRFGTEQSAEEALLFRLPFILQLHHLCHRTGAKIIVSSSWRELHTPYDLRKLIYEQHHIDLPFVEPTPRLTREAGESGASLRQREVQLWLTRAKSRGIKIHGLAIVDKFFFKEPLMRYHVHTEVGLTKPIANAVEALLVPRKLQ